MDHVHVVMPWAFGGTRTALDHSLTHSLTHSQTTIGLVAVHFLVHFLAVDLHDYNVKRPENFLVFTFYGGNVVHVLVHFFHCRSFFFAPL